MAQKKSKQGLIRIRDYSEPLQSQKETTAYGERFLHVGVFDNDPINFAYDISKYENTMIKTWREMAKNPYIDFAGDDIINEMLSLNDEVVYPIVLDLNATHFSDNIRKKIHDE